jgi:hypothetical protein
MHLCESFVRVTHMVLMLLLLLLLLLLLPGDRLLSLVPGSSSFTHRGVVGCCVELSCLEQRNMQPADWPRCSRVQNSRCLSAEVNRSAAVQGYMPAGMACRTHHTSAVLALAKWVALGSLAWAKLSLVSRSCDTAASAFLYHLMLKASTLDQLNRHMLAMHSGELNYLCARRAFFTCCAPGSAAPPCRSADRCMLGRCNLQVPVLHSNCFMDAQHKT